MSIPFRLPLRNDDTTSIKEADGNVVFDVLVANPKTIAQMRDQVEYAINAINSHDSLVAENEKMREILNICPPSQKKEELNCARINELIERSILKQEGVQKGLNLERDTLCIKQPEDSILQRSRQERSSPKPFSMGKSLSQISVNDAQSGLKQDLSMDTILIIQSLLRLSGYARHVTALSTEKIEEALALKPTSGAVRSSGVSDTPKSLGELRESLVENNLTNRLSVYLPIEDFEHLLNCLANQKYIRDVNADGLSMGAEVVRRTQLEMQQVIDDAWRKGMSLLSEIRCPTPTSEILRSTDASANQKTLGDL